MAALTLSVQSSFGQKISSSELSTPVIMSWVWGTSLSALQSQELRVLLVLVEDSLVLLHQSATGCGLPLKGA